MGDFIIDVELAKLDVAILRYVDDLGIQLPKVVKFTARLLNTDLSRLTPPRSLAQGRAAVRRDINRAVLALDHTKIKLEALKEAVLERKYDVVRTILSHMRDSWLAGYDLVTFNPELHRSARDSRGRVQRSKRRLTLDLSAHSRYVKTVQGRVGSTRAWWTPSARVLGNSAPSWISRHVPPGIAVVDNLHNLKHPRILMINAGKGVGVIDRSLIATAIRRRVVSMTRDVDQVLRGRASRYF